MTFYASQLLGKRLDVRVPRTHVVYLARLPKYWPWFSTESDLNISAMEYDAGREPVDRTR